MYPFFFTKPYQFWVKIAISHLGAPALTFGTDLTTWPSRVETGAIPTLETAPDYQMLEPKSEQRQKRPTIRNTLVLRSYTKPHLVKHT